MNMRHLIVIAALMVPALAAAQAPDAPAVSPGMATPPTPDAPSEPAAPSEPEATESPAPAEPAPASEAAEASATRAPAEPEATAPAEAKPASPTETAAEEGEADPDADEPATVRLAMRWGMHVYPDQSYDAVGDGQSHFAAEISADFSMTEEWAVGFAIHGGAESGTVYGSPSSFSDTSMHLSALYRWAAWPTLSVYGRLGPTVHSYSLQVGDAYAGDEMLTSEAWMVGARAGLGLEFWPLHRAFVPALESLSDAFALGLVFEAFYTQAFHHEWSSGRTDLGTFDPSGPGWTLGLTTQF